MDTQSKENLLMQALAEIAASAKQTFVVAGLKSYRLDDPRLEGQALRSAVRLVRARLNEVK